MYRDTSNCTKLIQFREMAKLNPCTCSSFTLLLNIGILI